MVTLQRSVRRLVLTGGFVAAIVAAPAAAAAFSHADTGSVPVATTSCPDGESEDVYTGSCTPELVPNSPNFAVPSGGSVPEVSGIPCTGSNTGQCIGLGEEQQAQGPGPGSVPAPGSAATSTP